MLDGASYEFIMNMIKKGYFNDRLKLIVAYQENKSIQSYFDLTAQEETMFETVVIKKLSEKEMIMQHLAVILKIFWIVKYLRN